MKLPQENRGNTKDIDGGNDFLCRNLKTQATKVKIDIWNYIKLRGSAQQRIKLTELRENLQNGRKYLQTIHHTMDLCLEYTKNSKS
jgi:hypothetical protein